MKKLIYVIMLFTAHNVIAQCYEGGCFEPEPLPITGYDFTQQFNEKRYWIEGNIRTGAPQICYQRLGLYPEFFRSPNIRCSPAQEVERPQNAPDGAQCWIADNVIVCQDPGGRVTIHHSKADVRSTPAVTPVVIHTESKPQRAIVKRCTRQSCK